MSFQATITPPTKESESKIWEIMIAPEHWPSQTNEMATLEAASRFVRISLCMGYTGAFPEVTESGAGIRIRFEGGYRNFGALERVLEWISNPRNYIC